MPWLAVEEFIDAAKTIPVRRIVAMAKQLVSIDLINKDAMVDRINKFVSSLCIITPDPPSPQESNLGVAEGHSRMGQTTMLFEI